MQATIAHPYAAPEAGKLRPLAIFLAVMVTGLVATTLLSEGRGRGVEGPAVNWDERVHIVATSEAPDGTLIETTCTGYPTDGGQVRTSGLCFGDVASVGDDVTVVHDPGDAGPQRTTAASVGLVRGDYVYLDLATHLDVIAD